MSKASGIIGFLSGAAIGAAGTYFGLRSWISKQVDLAAQDVSKEYEETIFNYSERINMLEKHVRSLEDELALAKIEKTPEDNIKEEKISTNVSNKPDPEEIAKEYTDYTKFAAGYSSTEEKKPDPEIETGKKKKRKPPYLIKPKEFCEDNGFDKQTLTYFVNDDLFLDEDNEIYKSAGRDIGKNNVNFLINESDGDIYVRSEDDKIDFHVVMTQDVYADFVGSSYEE